MDGCAWPEKERQKKGVKGIKNQIFQKEKASRQQCLCPAAQKKNRRWHQSVC
jgi:hypothetical protein